MPDKDPGKYYHAAFKLMVEEGYKSNEIIDAAINNMLAACSTYMTPAEKIELLEKVIEQVRLEHSVASARLQ